MPIDKAEARRLIDRQVDLVWWETQAANSSRNNAKQAIDSYWNADDWQRDKEWNSNLSTLHANWYSMDDIRAAYNEQHPTAVKQWADKAAKAINNVVYNAINQPKKQQFKTENPAITNKQKNKIIRSWKPKMPKTSFPKAVLPKALQGFSL